MTQRRLEEDQWSRTSPEFVNDVALPPLFDYEFSSDDLSSDTIRYNKLYSVETLDDSTCESPQSKPEPEYTKAIEKWEKNTDYLILHKVEQVLPPAGATLRGRAQGQRKMIFLVRNPDDPRSIQRIKVRVLSSETCTF